MARIWLIPRDDSLGNKVTGVEGGDKGYSINSDVICSVTLQNFSPWFGRCSFLSPSNEVIRISACHFGCLDVEISVITTDLTQSEKLTIRYGWLAIVRMGWTEIQVRVAIRGFVMYRSGYPITLRLQADIQERKFFLWDWPCTFKTEVKRGGNRRNWRRSSSLSLAYKISNCLSANHNPELWCVICTGVTIFAPVLQFLHWCYSFCSCCTGVTVFAPVLHFLHWCYTWTALLSANQNQVIFSCILLVP